MTTPDTTSLSPFPRSSMTSTTSSSTQATAGSESRTGCMAQTRSFCECGQIFRPKMYYFLFHSDSSVHVKRHVRLHTSKSARELYPDQKKEWFDWHLFIVIKSFSALHSYCCYCYCCYYYYCCCCYCFWLRKELKKCKSSFVVCSSEEKFSRAHNIHLSFSGQSQDSPRS